MPHSHLDEEAKGLLRRILRAQAYRQIMAANIRGHSLKFLLKAEGRQRLVQDMQTILDQVVEVQDLYTRLGGGDIRHEAAVKMERIPYPKSRFELATFLATSDIAEDVAMEGYVDSACEELAHVANEHLSEERVVTEHNRRFFLEFAADPEQAPLVKEVFRRWLVISLLSLGRPGTSADRRAVELGLRNRSCAESMEAYLERIRSLLDASGLDLSELAGSGVILPGSITT